MSVVRWPTAGAIVGVLFWAWRRSEKKRRAEQKYLRKANLSESGKDGREEYSVVTNGRHVELVVRTWHPACSKGVVLAFHSFAWHSGCFAELAATLNQRHFTLVGFDYEGHGRSGSEDKTRADVRRFEHLVSDAVKLLHYARDTFPNAPIFALGDGVGGTLASHLALRQPQLLNGLILCGAYLLPNVDHHPPSTVPAVLSAMESFLPDLRIATVDSASSDPTLGYDPFPSQAPTLRFFCQVHRGLTYLEHKLPRLTCPFLAVHGAGDLEASCVHSKELYAKAKAEDKTLIIYRRMRSCLFSELPEDRSQVTSDILAWLDGKTYGSVPSSPSVSVPLTKFQESDALLEHCPNYIRQKKILESFCREDLF